MNAVLETIFNRDASRRKSFFLISGPCVLEDEQIGFEIARKISEITTRLNIPFIFKASYKKANRSKLESFSGIGDTIALNILDQIGKEFGVPVITDIHSTEEAYMAARHVDVLQIPAFLCRQTELLLAAGKTGKAVNIKKGQFLSAQAMEFAIEKVRSTGNQKVLVTERGSSFGFNDLIVDFRGIPLMQEFDVPVVLDVTHSLQQPNQPSGITGGLPQLIETMAKAGVAAGIDGLFMEAHPDPKNAKSDGANMLPLNQLEGLLEKLLKIREAIKL